MAQQIMVIKFDDAERATLDSDLKARNDAAGALSKSISKMIKDVFNDARTLAKDYPSLKSLTDIQDRLNGIRSIVSAVPGADGSEEISQVVDEISTVIESARNALQAIH